MFGVLRTEDLRGDLAAAGCQGQGPARGVGVVEAQDQVVEGTDQATLSLGPDGRGDQPEPAQGRFAAPLLDAQAAQVPVGGLAGEDEAGAEPPAVAFDGEEAVVIADLPRAAGRPAGQRQPADVLGPDEVD